MSYPLAVKSKTGIATARGGTVAHRTTQVRAVLIGGRLQFAATWRCGGGYWMKDVIVLATETSHGGPVCYGCDPEEPCVYPVLQRGPRPDLRRLDDQAAPANEPAFAR